MGARKRKTAQGKKGKTGKTVKEALYKVVDENGKFVFPGPGVPLEAAERNSTALLQRTSVTKVYDPGDE